MTNQNNLRTKESWERKDLWQRERRCFTFWLGLVIILGCFSGIFFGYRAHAESAPNLKVCFQSDHFAADDGYHDQFYWSNNANHCGRDLDVVYVMLSFRKAGREIARGVYSLGPYPAGHPSIHRWSLPTEAAGFDAIVEVDATEDWKRALTWSGIKGKVE